MNILFNQNIMAFLVNTCTSSVNYFLTSPYTSWFPVVTLAVLASFTILILIYSLSTIINAGKVRSWIKNKFLDLLITLVLIFSFATVSTLICSSNPTPYFSKAGLLPTACSTQSVNDIYALSLCDLNQFNTYALQFNQYLYFILLSLSITPKVSGYLSAGLAGNIGIAGINPTLSVQTGAVDLDPFGKINKFDGFILPALYSLALLNEVELLLLSSSPLLFAIFIAIGLIARSFEITRTFGNGMIAFAIGLGFIFPIIVSLNYGFMDYGIQNALNLGFGQFTNGVTPALLPTSNPIVIFASAAMGFALGSGSPLGQAATLLPEYFFVYLGLIVVGIMIIPLLTFTIVTSFVSDFSGALGEKFDFSNLLINLL
ncbi:MAG: hypothetical protein QXD23_00470 [Candidatus Micrarchaeaceae archaeon]